MGGKSKQSQRTKNNARPSSSGRSAELLNNAMNLDPSLMGTGMMSALFTSLAPVNIDQSLEPELSMFLKKLNKKDPITKIKALQELTELVNKSNVDDVVAALPTWAHFYKILTVETDCKVREITQLCHGAVVGRCGRRVAPVLRTLMPAWLQAQYDDHVPALQHARRSLQTTFPENKLPEAISFCKAEVVSNLLDNLLGNAEKTLTRRIDNPEERALQIERIVASSLHGLQYLIQHLPSAHNGWLWEQLAPLFNSNAFWKLASDTNKIRAAWYATMTGILSRFASELPDKIGARLAKLLLGAAREQTPLVAEHLWGCALELMLSVPDWHKWVDKKDLLTKRIIDLLEGGGWGNARQLTALLLPLLAHLPPELVNKQFYEAFFEAFFKSFEKKNILSSKSERQYWMTSLSECLKYLSIQTDDYVMEVTTSVHRTWLKMALSTKHEGQLRTNLIKHSAANMTDLVKFWLEKSKKEEKYDQLVRNFWQNVGSTALTQIDQSDLNADNITQIIDGHILLLKTLKTSFLNDAKKTQSIKFDGDAPSEVELKTVPKQVVDTVSAERYRHNLNEVVQKICCSYFEFADKNDISEAVLTPLITILNDFENKELYLGVAKHFSGNSVYDLYEKVLKKWMLTDTMRCKTVVDIIFMVLKHLTEEEQDAVLNSFEQFPGAGVEWSVSAALCHTQWGCRSVRRWLRGALVQQALLALCRRLLHARCTRARAALRVCLSTDPGGEMLISEETASKIAAVVSDALHTSLDEYQPKKSTNKTSDESDLELEHVASVASHLATALASKNPDDNYLQLLLNLFQLNLDVPMVSPRLSAASWRELAAGAHDGVCSASPPARRRLRTCAAAAVARRLHRLVDKVSITQIEHITSVCPHLLVEWDDPEPPSNVTELVEFTTQLFDFEYDTDPPIEMFALRYDCIKNNLNCPFEDDNEIIKTIVKESSDIATEVTKEKLVPYINKFLFRAIYLRTLLLKECRIDDDNDEEDTENDDVSKPKERKTWCNTLMNNEYFQKEFCNIVRQCVVLNALQEACGYWVHYDIILQAKTKLDTILEDILSEMSKESRSNILSKLSERAASEGYYWAMARRFFEMKVDPDQDHVDFFTNMELAKLEEIITGSGFFHSLQGNARWCSDEMIRLRCKFAVMTRSILVAYEAACKDQQFMTTALEMCQKCNLDSLVDLYHKHDPIFLFERDISTMSWREVVCEASILDCLVETLKLSGWRAEQHHWDFATVSLCAVVSNLRNAEKYFHTTKVAIIAHAGLRLYEFVEEFISNIPSESIRRQPSPHVADLMAEWRDVFAPALNRDVYCITAALLENPTSTLPSNTVRVITSVTAALSRCDWQLVDKSHRLGSLSLERLVRACGAALLHPAPAPAHRLAYQAALQLVPPAAARDAEAISSWNADESEGENRSRPTLAPDWLQQPFTTALQLASAALEGVTAGIETCEMKVGSDSHRICTGALLLAEVLHTLTTHAKGELEHYYSQIYRDGRYVETLLPVSLRLLPDDLLQAALLPGAAPLPAHYQDWFHAAPHYPPDDPRWHGALGALACRGVHSSLSGAGSGGARGWWGAAPRPARALSRLCAAYTTQHLARRQLLHLLHHKPSLEDTTVTVHWNSYEAEAVFHIEDRAVTLCIQFPAEYPLALPRITAPTVRPAVNTNWIAMYIAYQNGTVLNAIKMWTEAISNKVESAPQCYICYCRLHPSSGHLPNVTCHQCQNRFHTSCLYKWFASSMKSNCPLCRTAF